MLSPEMLGFDGRLDVFEIVLNEKKNEFVPEFDTQEFLETYRSQIEGAIERQELNLESLYYLRLLGFEGKQEKQEETIGTLAEAIKAAKRSKDRGDPMSLFDSAELDMIFRVLKPESSYRYGKYLKMERREFEEELQGSRPSYETIMLAASMSPGLIQELDSRVNISGRLEHTVLSIRSEVGRSEPSLDHLMNNLVVLKEVFPKEMPNIDIDEWEDFKQMFRRNVEIDWFWGIKIAFNLYILASEKAEFTENGLVITPRKHLDIEAQTQPIPQIRRF